MEQNNRRSRPEDTPGPPGIRGGGSTDFLSVTYSYVSHVGNIANRGAGGDKQLLEGQWAPGNRPKLPKMGLG